MRVCLDRAAEMDGRPGVFGFLPDLKFYPPQASNASLPTHVGGEVDAIDLEPVGELRRGEARTLAQIVGRSLALWSLLGVSDLHWENLVLGRSADGGLVFSPLDIESIFDDFALPTETKLLPDADPEVAAVCRHACGVRRVLPFLGKPIDPAVLVAMAGDYLATLDLLCHYGRELGRICLDVPDFAATPIRVCLRGTDIYVHAMQGPQGPVWPPFLDAEVEQMERGDVPYFFRLPGRPGIHYYADPAMQTIATLPMEGDMPQLQPLVDLSRGLGSSPVGSGLRDEGLFAVLGAFDHPSFAGRLRSGRLEVEFGDGFFAVETADEVLETERDLSDFVGSVYLPCRCGEVRSVFVPPVTACAVGHGADV